MLLKIVSVFFRKNIFRYFVGEIWLAHVLDRFHKIPHYIWLIINKRRSINQTLLIWWKLTGVCYIPAPASSCGRMTCLVWHDKCLCFLILSFCHLSSTSAARKMTNLPSREWERDKEKSHIIEDTWTHWFSQKPLWWDQ